MASAYEYHPRGLPQTPNPGVNVSQLTITQPAFYDTTRAIRFCRTAQHTERKENEVQHVFDMASVLPGGVIVVDATRESSRLMCLEEI
jgi:hypothetical protein